MTREEAIKTIKNRPSFTTMNYDERKQFSEALEIAVRSLEALEQQEKTGKWVVVKDSYVECSICGGLAPSNDVANGIIWKMSNYCPDCGAKMIEPQENEDNE